MDELPNKILKKNPVWKNALQEQNLCDDIAKFGEFELEDNKKIIKIDRGIETYKYSVSEDENENKSDSKNHLNSATNNVSIESTDSTGLTERVGHLIEFDTQKSRAHIHVTEFDSEQAVTKEIVKQLNESNTDIINRCVKLLGRKKALEILYATQDIEDSGGMVTSEGYRRRSPGGVYLLLVKRDDTILNCQKKEIFIEDFVKKKKKKAAKRLRQRIQFDKAKAKLKDQVKHDKIKSTTEDFSKDAMNEIDEDQLIYFDQ